MNIVVIPEDPTYDRHIVQPVIRAMMAWIGKSNATIRFPEGNLGGTGSALDWASLEPIVDQYQYLADLFLLCVDRDDDAGRRDSLNYLEEKAQTKLTNEGFGEIAFFAVAAQQEIEVWALGGIALLELLIAHTSVDIATVQRWKRTKNATQSSNAISVICQRQIDTPGMPSGAIQMQRSATFKTT